jgi:uncharacterized membrane protein
MQERIGNFLTKIKKVNFKELFFEISNKIVVRKKQISLMIVVVALLAFGSFLVDYYGFSYKLQKIEKSNSGIMMVDSADVKTDNFSLNEKNMLVPGKGIATLVLENQGKYVQNLELNFAENPDYGIKIKYVDSKTGQEVVLENQIEKNMLKNNLNFLNFAVYHVDNNPEKITILTENSQTSISDIKIDNSYHFNFYHFIFIFSVFFLIFIFVRFGKNIGQKPEYVFFAVAMICGTLISISEQGTFVSWDEKIHYNRADDISFNNVINNGIKGRIASSPFSSSIKEQKAIDGYFDNQKKAEKKSKNKKTSFFDDFSLQETYNQVAYVPSALALMLGRLIHLPNHMIFTFGCWINVLAYASVIFFAIRKLKTGKMIMSIVALFPTAIFGASNYGYDYWIIAFTMLGLAYLFSELQQPDKKITKKNAIFMLGAFVIGLGPKAIYFPIMILLFLLKKEKFASLGQYKKFIWASIFSILFVVGSFMLPFVVGGPGKGDTRGGSEVNSAQQVKFILSDPVAYAKILFNFMKGYIDPRNAEGFISSFAYLGSIKGFGFVMTVLIVATFTDKNKYDKWTADWKTKVLMVGIYLAAVALICSALYVAFTPVKSVTIAGVQYRYLIPLVFPLLFVIGCSRIKNPFNKNIYNILIFAVMAGVLLWGIWDLIVKIHY